MTIGRLREMLSYYDDNMPVVFHAENSMYGDNIEGIDNYKGICSFYGDDYKAVVLTSAGQCGTICDEDDLDL